MAITRLNFNTPADGGDNATGAFQKLDANDFDLDTRLVAVAASVATNEEAIEGLGNAATKDVGRTANTVAAGDDPRFFRTGLKNLIINGALDFWQRGQSFTTGGYNADRFAATNVGNTFAISRQVVAAGANYSDSRYSALFSITSVAGAGNYTRWEQRIENVRQTAGKKVTVSFVAYSGTAGKKIGIGLEQNFGTGGGASATAVGVGQAVQLTANPTRYAVTFDVPTSAGKVFGTNNNDYTAAVFWLDAGTSFAAQSGGIGQLTANIAITDVQVELGDTATSFERRPIGLEYSLCARYCQKSFPLDMVPANTVDGKIIRALGYGTNAVLASLDLPVRMRITPSVGTFSPTVAGTANNFAVLTAGWISATGIAVFSNTDVQINWTMTVAGITSFNAAYCQGSWFADAEL